MSLLDTLKGLVDPGTSGGLAPSTGQQIVGGIKGTGAPMSVQGLWVAMGGPSSEKETASAVAIAESHCDNNADNNVCCACIMQVNYKAHTQYDRAKLKSDAGYCMQAAVEIWHSQGWGAWQTYTNGAYKSHLGKDCTVGVDEPISTATSAITDPLQAVASFLRMLTQASTWFRVGKVVLGAIILLVVFYLLIRG